MVKTSRQHVLASILCLLCLALSPAVPVQAEMNDINGTWQITAVLASTTLDEGPRPGFPEQEVWRIVQQGGQAQLTTPGGTVAGQFISQTPEFPMGCWVFRAEVPNLMNQPNLGEVFETVIAGGPPSDYIQGGSTVTCYSGNAYTGQWAPIGMESWRFEGYR